MIKTPRKEISLEQIDTHKLANEIIKHASESRNEEELRIRVETTLRPILEKLGINWAHYEHRHKISGVRKDALYGHVIIEYKAPGKLDNKTEFNKAKEQVKDYIKREAVDEKYYGRYFGVILDGNKIAFVRFRKNEWEEQEEPLNVNAQTVLRLLEWIIGVRRKPIDAEFLLLDFGPKSEISRKVILALYDSLVDKNTPRTDMLFNDWRRVFSQVCSYSKDKLAGLVEYYGLADHKKIDVEKLLYAIHTYYTILMKLLTSEIVTLFADSLLGSYLKRIEEAYYRSHKEMLEEMKDLEEGGIFATIGIRNFLEADYFAWYLDEWNEKIAESIFELTKRLLDDYDPATVVTKRVKDLFKRLYQNLVPRDIRHRLGEYFTPDWLAELLLNEVGYDGNPDKRVLDPACGSGTFLVLVIKRIKEYADEHFLDKQELLQKIINNVKGIDLNPLAVLASKANYLIALSDLLRYRPKEGIEIPIYLADSISVERGQKWKTLDSGGEEEFRLYTTEGEFWIPKEIIDKNILKEILLYIDTGVKLKYSEKEFQEFLNKALKKLNVSISKVSFGRIMRLYKKIYDLEYKYHKNKIWTQLLKNSFAPLLIGKFDYVVGNPPWIHWSNLPESYREKIKELYKKYNILPPGPYSTKIDISTLFVYRCIDYYLKSKGILGFLITQIVFKSFAGSGFLRLRTDNFDIKLLKVHDLSELLPFEGAKNRTALFVAVKGEKTQFPIPYILYKSDSKEIDQEISLEEFNKKINKITMWAEPIGGYDPRKEFIPPLASLPTRNILEKLRNIIGKSKYKAHEGVSFTPRGIFLINIKGDIGSDALIIENMINYAKLNVKKIICTIEKDLVYPVIFGKDLFRYYFKSNNFGIVPYNLKCIEPFSEKELKTLYPNTFEYLKKFEKELKSRADIKRNKSQPFYFLYRLNKHILSKFKVGWRDIDKEIKACMISPENTPIDNKIPIPDYTVNYIAVENDKEAHYICSILNSTISNFVIKTYHHLHLQPHILDHLNVPKFNPKEKLHIKLSELSKKAHELAKKYYEQNDLVAWEELKKVEEEIDKTVAKLYGITDEELEEIKKTLRILKEGEAEEEESEDEEPIELPKPKDIEIKIEPLFIKENEASKLSCTIFNNSEKTLSDIKLAVYLDSKLLSSENIKNIDKGSFHTISFEPPKLKSGEYDLRILLDIDGIKTEEKRKLFVGAEKKAKKFKSALDKEIEEMLK
ncbi:MAG: N-6 DNA methylase [Candidatus Aenigmatarchaeota archaeon]